MNRSILILPVLLLGLSACGNREAAPPAVAETSTAPQAAAAAPATSGDAVSSISPHAGLIDPAPNSQQAAGAAGSIDFDLPQAWQSKPPSSGMRLAQATIPGPGGPADLAVFFFGPGGGGPVDANIERWVGQGGGAPALTALPIRRARDQRPEESLSSSPSWSWSGLASCRRSRRSCSFRSFRS